MRGVESGLVLGHPDVGPVGRPEGEQRADHLRPGEDRPDRDRDGLTLRGYMVFAIVIIAIKLVQVTS